MLKKPGNLLRSLSSLQLIFISSIASVLLALIVSTAFALVGWGETNAQAMFLIGIDVFIASLIVFAVIINFSGRRTVPEKPDLEHEAMDVGDLLLQKLRFEHLFRNIPIAMVLMDQQGRVLQINSAFESMFQWSYADIEGKGPDDLIVPDRLLEEGREFTRRTLHHEVVRAETIRKRRDGSELEVEVYGVPIISHGASIGIYALYQDISARKEAEKELRKLLRAVVQSPASIMITDPGGLLEYVNPKFLETTGYSFDEVVGKNPRFLKSGVVGADEYKDLWHSITHGHEWRGEFCNKRKDGELFWEYASISPIRDTDGTVTHFIAVKEDITERKKAEQALRESEDRFHSFFDASFEGIVFSENGIIVDVNLRLAEMFGTFPEKMIGQPILDFVDPADRDSVKAHIKSNSFRIHEHHAMRIDGSTFPVETRARMYVYKGRKMRVTGVRDITERRKAQAEILDWKQRYELVGSISNQVVYDHELASGTIIWSGSVEQVLGYTPAEILGGFEQWNAIVHPDDRAQLTKIFENALTIGSLYETEFRLVNKAGETIWVNDRGFFMSDAQGISVRRVGRLADITERKKVEGERLKLEERLRQIQKMEAIGKLAGGLAHDFNNLLAPVIGYTQLLKERFQKSDQDYQKLEDIEKAGERAKELTHQLLSLGRQQTLKMESINLSALLGEFIPLLKPSLREDIALIVPETSELWSIIGDIGQLRQVITNLALNAQDAMPKGGTLTISADNIVLDEVYAKLNLNIHPGPYVILRVKDTGIGMDAQTLQHVFEPFMTTKEGASGLGLAIAYGIIKQHKGSIVLESEPGKGTSATLYFPKEEGLETTAEKPPLWRTKEHKETIIVVEDSPMVRSLATTLLREEGYTVFEAESAKECFAVLNEINQPVELLLTDVVMPGLNGKELYERLKHRLPKMKVLFMSGYAENVIAHHGVLEEGIAFIQKPFSLKSFISKVEEVLRTE